MESSDPDEPDKKRPHLSSLTPAMARNSTTSQPHNNSVDATALHFQNQKLVQETDSQKHELQDLETKIYKLKEKQSSYDESLIVINQLWNQLVDDLVFLGLQAGGGGQLLQNLGQAGHSQGSIPSCPAEDMFLCRLLLRDSIEVRHDEQIVNYVKEALTSRHASTMELFKLLEDILDTQREKTANIVSAWNVEQSPEDAIVQLSKIDEMMKEEATNLGEIIEILHLKHKAYADEIQIYVSSHLMDQTEIKRLSEELDESMAELEECRRKLVSLMMQKDVTIAMHVPTLGVVNGNLSPEKPAERTIGFRELKDSIEETKILAADRLSELQDAWEDNLTLSNQLKDLENDLMDEKYVHSSRLYVLLNDQLRHLTAEVDRYKSLTEALQTDRSHVLRREKDLNAKLESVDVARSSIDNNCSRIEELEHQLQKILVEKNDLEIEMEEAVQDSAREDIKGEFHVMASALSKEMGMMESQLKRWKDTAHEAASIREKVQALETSLTMKTKEKKGLTDLCAQQMMEIKSLKSLVEKLLEDKLELELFLDMYGQETYDERDLVEIKESERRACSQADVLRIALDDHSLELRVKAANETEAACQQRLSAAEIEITELRSNLDSAERDILELTEAIKIKDGEADAYISEIETIGQAYEDMQTQNQHLLQQVTERDDLNIKLVSESVKSKQVQSLLQSEKQALGKQLQQINASLESLKTKIALTEDQMKVSMTDVIRSTREERHLTISLEIAKWDLADAEKELKWLKTAVASSEKEYEQTQQQITDIEAELESERSSREKLEEELKELNSKVAKLTSETGEAAIKKLQDEINACKTILKCSICNDHPKEVVIVKCYHLFCSSCIQQRIERRNRKCPACGTAFGQNDVRAVKI
ncbi:E3 ubiquitin-protein ligase BRE1-like 2 [Cucumis melo var. makuwa]|uniref:E3 ubiquitin protein ligase n=3 Tax=Cucumis melo TaxID=3656 RepID=A0A5D3DEC1_CUCMM|nr:E3 ubiquitin-protein ligase BRE1-like 2 isoform X1 [Cucumis melo]TYK21679.1 E3 ubiquitin-protein ligase BRE1-like 2 [Cucumis melo var. makuwa]